MYIHPQDLQGILYESATSGMNVGKVSSRPDKECHALENLSCWYNIY